MTRKFVTRKFAILETYERRIDLKMGRSKFLDWVETLERVYTDRQTDAIIAALMREALAAKSPAAFTVWASKGPIGMWMSDYAYDKVKRMEIQKKGSGTEPVQSILRRSGGSALGL